jgi:hypothetical protein
MDVRQVLKHGCIVDGRSALGHLHVPLPFERREHHEHVGRTVALVFVIEPRRVAVCASAPGVPRFLSELLGLFVQTDQGTIRIVRPCVDGQHVLHGGYESAVCFGRDDPLRFEVWLKFAFFFKKTRPIVLLLARSTMSSSTTFFSSNRRVQRAHPAGGSEQADAISLASFSPSKIGRDCRGHLMGRWRLRLRGHRCIDSIMRAGFSK